MIESPLSRIEIKILLVMAILAIVTGVGYYSYTKNTEEHEAAKAEAPEPTVSAGWHLLKTQEGDKQLLRIVNCSEVNKCTSTGYSYDATDKDEVKKAEEMFAYFVKPVPPTRVLEVVH